MSRPITLTEGSLPQNILRFSLPLIASNLLQALFNMSDIAVVGRYSGAAALGSVGSCAILVSLFTGLPLGMGSGINAITARFLGARDYAKVKSTVRTAFLVSAVYGLIIMLAGIALTRRALAALGTKEELLDGAVLYLRVYLLGTPAMALYNFGNGVLSAAGDSKRPLYYLLTAGILNVVLNLFFVIALHLDVLGVALASVLSQCLSAGLVLLRLLRCKESYALELHGLKLEPAVARSILLLGIPAAMQYAIFALANLFIQSSVNSFDTLMVEGNSAAANADSLVYDTMAAFYSACTTFIAQNYGAGKADRIRKTYGFCLACSFGIAAVFCMLLRLFSSQFLGLFTTDEAVIEAGWKRLNIMTISYSFSAFMDCSIAACRGLGDTVIPTVIVVLGSCVLRIIWVYTVFAYFHTILSLYLVYLFSWGMTALCEILYLRKIYRATARRISESVQIPRADLSK